MNQKFDIRHGCGTFSEQGSTSCLPYFVLVLAYYCCVVIQYIVKVILRMMRLIHRNQIMMVPKSCPYIMWYPCWLCKSNKKCVLIIMSMQERISYR